METAVNMQQQHSKCSTLHSTSMERNTRNDLTVASCNTPCKYFDEYKLNEFFETIVSLFQLNVTKDHAKHLQFVQEKLPIVLNAIQILMTYSESSIPVNLNKLNFMVLNLIRIKYDMLNDLCIRTLNETWNRMPKCELRSKHEDAFRQSAQNITSLINRLSLPLTNCEILTSVEEELHQIKIGLFENGCADMRGLIDTFERRITDMWTCMEKLQFGKLCPVKLPLLHQLIEKHFNTCLKIHEMFECSEKDVPVDIADTVNKLTSTTAMCVIYNDIESLDAVLKNLNLALSVDFDKEKILGKWVIERAVQLIGEHVKSTIDSPKISQSMDKALEKANVPMKEMKFIRNKLSHSKILTLFNRKELEEPSRSEYQDLKHDFIKVRSIFAKALSRKEFNLLLEFTINLEQNYGKEIAEQNLVGQFIAIKDCNCLKDIVKALEEFALKAQQLERMNVIVSYISEILNFLKFREVRRNVHELFINAESTFSFCSQVIQFDASDTENEDAFKPRMIPLLSSKYSKYMKSMFTSMPTAVSFKAFSEKFNDNLPCVPKSQMELFNLFITTARDEILPETHERIAICNADNIFDVDLRKLLMTYEFYNEDEIKKLETKWKLLRTIQSWKKTQDAKNTILFKLQSSQIDRKTFEDLIGHLCIDEGTTRTLVELIDKDLEKAQQIIQEIPNFFEEFLDQFVTMKDKIMLVPLNQDEHVILQAMIVSFLQTQERNSQVENFANNIFRTTLSCLQEELSENECVHLKRKFDYSLHFHHVLSNLRIQTSTHFDKLSTTKDSYKHLLLNLQPQDKKSIEKILAGKHNTKRIQTALKRITDDYGKCLKSFRENDQLSKNIKAFSEYARAMCITEQQTDLLISTYKRHEFVQFEAFYYNRIDALEEILHAKNAVIPNSTLVEKLYRRFKYNEIMKAAVEMMLLDLLNVLKYLSNSLQNYNQLEKIINICNDILLKNDQATQVKNMRNALAHGCLTWHHLTQVFATALTFILNGKTLLALHLVLSTEGGQTYLLSALNSNSWEHTLVSNGLLEIGELSNTIQQSNLWKDKVWRSQLKRLLCDESEELTKPLEKSLLFQKLQVELFDAARRNDIPKLKYCLKRDANVNIKNNQMWTPLHYAANSESLEAISLLLQHEANVNGSDIRSWTPLHLAVMRNSLESVRILIDNQAIINCHTHNNLTPLQIATIVDASAIKQLLCKHGAADIPFNGNIEAASAITSCKLTTATRHDNDDKLINEAQFMSAQQGISGHEMHVSKFINGSNNEQQLLPVSSDDHLSVKAENVCHGHAQEPLITDSAEISFVRDTYINPRSNNEKQFATRDTFSTLNPSRIYAFDEMAHSKQSIISSDQSSIVDSHNNNKYVERLLQAITSGALPAVKMCLNNVTDMNVKGNDGNTPVLKAASVGAVDILKLLLEYGADVNSEDKEGTTPLISASINGHVECVKELLKNKADVEHKDNYGHKALHFAISEEFEDIVKMLVANHATVNVRNRSYGAPIHDAVFSRNSRIVKFLLENGALVNAENPSGETPLLAAFANHDWPTFKILLENGGDVNAMGNYGKPILYCAVSSELVEIVDLVLEKGAEVNRPDSNGRTPLMEAALFGHSHLVERLLTAGALIDVKDSKGNTAISQAERNDHHDIIKLLREKQEAKARGSNMKDCPDAEVMSDSKHCHADLDTACAEASHVEGNIPNLIVEIPVERDNFGLAIIAVREIVWVVVQEFCMQLISMVI